MLDPTAAPTQPPGLIFAARQLRRACAVRPDDDRQVAMRNMYSSGVPAPDHRHSQVTNNARTTPR